MCAIGILSVPVSQYPDVFIDGDFYSTSVSRSGSGRLLNAVKENVNCCILTPRGPSYALQDTEVSGCG